MHFLSSERIFELVNDSEIPAPSVYKSVSSTNTVAKAHANDGALPWHCVASCEQAAGRGRMGREFFSPGGGLYMSIVLRPDFHAETVSLITGAAAVAVSLAIEDCFDIVTDIKWVNDIYFRNKKICGILTEAAYDGDVPRYVVTGIGINIFAPKGGFPPNIAAVAGSLFDHSPIPDHANCLCAAVLRRMKEMYSLLSEGKGAEVAAIYRNKCFIIGKNVNIISAGEIRDSGFAEDVDDSFRLVLRHADNSVSHIQSGEVSARLQQS